MGPESKAEIAGASGYRHHDYAASLQEFGKPRPLRRCGGWLLERQIEGSASRDAMGCYPLFACNDWSKLHIDLDETGPDIISVALVADPFGEYDPTYLGQCFPDLVVPFKEHHIIDLRSSPDSFVDAHHARNARKALATLEVEHCPRPSDFAAEWIALYDNLIQRHGIRGLTAFSVSSFEKQLAVPGLVMFRASYKGENVGMLLWYADSSVGYYHLGAYTDEGYKLRASFALFWRAIEHFGAQGLRWLNLGAGAGASNDGADGLTRFKRGWANGTRTAYLCGRIFDRDRYNEIVRARQLGPTDYFPAYRKGEFG